MKAMILNDYGENSKFVSSEVSEPMIKKGHVIIKIAATSVNTVDTMIRTMGNSLPLSPELPAILGMDFAGTITEVGEEVENYVVGDEVYGCAGGLGDLSGTLAEFMLADANLIAKKPASLSMVEAAALPLVGITAYEGLMRTGIQANQRVLVHGGAGGVGHVAVQLAKYFGAHVFATGSKEKQLDLIQSYGATPINYRNENVIDYVEEHTQGHGFDVVFDSVGGANIVNSLDAVALNGHVATTVSMCELDLTQAHFKGASLHVVFMLIPMLHNFKREAHGKILRRLADIVDSGHVKPFVHEEVFTFDNVMAAHQCLSSGQCMGKVVVSA